MRRRRDDVEMLRELAAIARRVDRVAQRAARADPPRRDVVRRVADVLLAISRTCDPIYDADPRLLPRGLVPSAYTDVHRLADILEDANDEVVTAEVARQIIALAPRLSRARRETLVAWCRAQPRKVLRLRPLDRLLDSPHRSIRFHAARALARAGAPALWNAHVGDIDRVALARWRRAGRTLRRSAR